MSPSLTRLIVVLGLIANASLLQAQLVTYTFGPASSPTAEPTTVAPHLSASSFSGFVGDPALVSTGSTLLDEAHFTATTWAGAAPGNNYFEFTLSPAGGHGFVATSFRFNYRATSTGPATLSLSSSTNNYATSYFSLITTKDGAWHDSGTLLLSASSDSPVTFRLYGYGASSNGGTLRVDNIVLDGSPVPEPAAATFVIGVAALAVGTLGRRARRPKA